MNPVEYVQFVQDFQYDSNVILDHFKQHPMQLQRLHMSIGVATELRELFDALKSKHSDALLLEAGDVLFYLIGYLNTFPELEGWIEITLAHDPAYNIDTDLAKLPQLILYPWIRYMEKVKKLTFQRKLEIVNDEFLNETLNLSLLILAIIKRILILTQNKKVTFRELLTMNHAKLTKRKEKNTSLWEAGIKPSHGMIMDGPQAGRVVESQLDYITFYIKNVEDEVPAYSKGEELADEGVETVTYSKAPLADKSRRKAYVWYLAPKENPNGN